MPAAGGEGVILCQGGRFGGWSLYLKDGNGRGKGGAATILVNGRKVGSGRVERTNANIFSADDAADVGVDEGTNVSSAYKEYDNKFTGKIEKVTVDVR